MEKTKTKKGFNLFLLIDFSFYSVLLVLEPSRMCFLCSNSSNKVFSTSFCSSNCTFFSVHIMQSNMNWTWNKFNIGPVTKHFHVPNVKSNKNLKCLFKHSYYLFERLLTISFLFMTSLGESINYVSPRGSNSS